MASSEDYRSTQIMTASPMELVLMLYDECIKSLKNAEASFEGDSENRLQDINNHLLRAQNIVTELTVSLDMDKGGEVAGNLQRLYDFMAFHLSSANARKIVEPVIDVREMMEGLRDSWQKIAEKEHESDSNRPPVASNNSLLAAG